MKQITFLFYAFALGTLVFSGGCKDKTITPPISETELSPKTVIMNQGTNSLLTTVDSTTLTFTGNSAQLDSIETGDILVSDVTNIAKFGYLRKVTSVTKNGSNLSVSTINATLTEAIKTGGVQFSKQITAGDIAEEDSSGAELRTTTTTGNSISFNINRSFDLDGNSNTTFDKITFEGTVDLSPILQYDVDIKDFNLEHFIAKFTFSNNCRLKVKYEISDDRIGIQQTWVLKTFRLTPITVFIGGFPVVLDQRIVFVVGIDGEVKAELQAEVINNYSAELGIDYKKTTGWTNIKNQTNNLNGTLALSGEASLEGWLQPRYEIRPYGIKSARVYLAAKASVKADATIGNPQTTLFAHLKMIAKFFGKAQMQIFSTSVIDYDLEFWSQEYTVWQGQLNYSPVDITSGLVAYYPFNGNANDESGKNNNGSVYGGAILSIDRKGNANEAYSFDGVDDKIVTTFQQQNIEKYSISFWVKLSNNVTGTIWDARGQETSTSLSRALNVRLDNNYLYFEVHGDAFQVGVATSNKLPLNQWIHVTSIFEGINGQTATPNQFKIYLNGTLAATTNRNMFNPQNFSNTYPPFTGLGSGVMGYYEAWQNSSSSPVNTYFNGELDDIHIYNRALNESEIQALYNE